MAKDVLVEVPPCEFGDPGYGAGVPGVEFAAAVGVAGGADGGAGAESACGEVGGDHGSTVGGGEVAGGAVLFYFVFEEVH